MVLLVGVLRLGLKVDSVRQILVKLQSHISFCE